MSDASTDLRALADDLAAVALAVPGVQRLQARPSVGLLARRLLNRGTASVGVAISGDETLVEVDVAVQQDHAGPAVAREVAAALLARLALVEMPPARVDVRIVSVG